MELLKDLEGLSDDPYGRAKEAKKRGIKVIAITPMHFPEELVHASGALPIIFQTSNEPITVGWEHILPHFCAFVRTNVDLSVKGRFDFLDGVVISDVCLQTRGMASVIQRYIHTPFMFVDWPLDSNMKPWVPVLLKRLGRVRKKLEEITGKPIKDEDIIASIRLYNLNRQLLRQIGELRSQKPGVLTAKEMQMLVISGMVMPKEEHNDLLKRVISEFAQTSTPNDGRVRIWLSGHMCLRVLPDILDLIEDAGAVVVGDDLYVGYRYYAADTPLNLPPMEALIWRYFNIGVPCPTRLDRDLDWGEFLINNIKKAKAKAAVSLLVKQCEAQTYHYPSSAQKLAAKGIPLLRIETDHEMVSLERIKTQFRGMVESIKNKSATRIVT